MTNVSTTYNNFSRGRIDHDMLGRFDLPIYQTGADLFDNFFSNFKGNAIFRTGFESMVALEDAELIEFKFNNTQAYVCVFTAGHIRFLAYDTNGNFGWVLNGGVPLDIANPYTLQQCRELDYSQNGDSMVVVHPLYPPRKLVRTAANAFTFNTFARTADPFDDPSTGVTGWPSCVQFYKGRLFYAATTKKITSFWGSKSNAYDDFTLPASPTAKDAFAFTIADIAQKIEWLYPGDNSLIAGAGDGIVAINGGSVGSAITPATVDATLTAAEACNSVYPLSKDGLIFMVSRNGRNVNYFSYDLLSERFASEDANFISYDITVGGMTKIRWKKDKNDLIFAICNGNLLSVNFKQKENIIGWHRHQTQGQFQTMAVIPDNLGNPQLFVLVNRPNGWFLERQGKYVEFAQRVNFFSGNESADNDAYTRLVAEQLKSCIHLDNAQSVSNLQSNLITYNAGTGRITATAPVFSAGSVGKHIVYQTLTGYESGRFEITGYISTTVVTVAVLQAPTQLTYSSWYLTFSTLAGLTQYVGQTIGIVTDGGYLKDVLVPGSGNVDLGKQVSQCIIGLKYKGTIKSFSLGFSTNGANTQGTMKTVKRAGMRCTTTAGGKFGTSPYRLTPIQDLRQGNLNYLPPIPIDGTKYVNFTDNNEFDKFIYIVQDEPLPMNVGAVMLEANYSVKP